MSINPPTQVHNRSSNFPKTTDIMRIKDHQLVHLPPVVQKYLKHAGVIGHTRIDTVNLKYKGQFRLGIDKPWMPIRAEQVYTTNPPSFQWKAHFKMFGLWLMYGQDTYKNGEAHMFGKLASLFNIFDETGDNLLQGTMMRYLQEMIWFPTAFLSDYVKWCEVDNHAADATFTWANKQVTGRFYFDDAGRVLSFLGQRYNGDKKGLYPWATPMTEYGSLDGLQIPITGCGVWQLPEGDLSYITVNITAIHYNTSIPQF